jgi:hypothetical protein
VRDFGSTNDRSGSDSTEAKLSADPGMSVVPPVATDLFRHREMT